MNESHTIILTVEEVANWLRIPPSTVYKLCQNGEIPGLKIGKHWRFQRKVIDAWLDQKTQAQGLQEKLTPQMSDRV